MGLAVEKDYYFEKPTTSSTSTAGMEYTAHVNISRSNMFSTFRAIIWIKKACNFLISWYFSDLCCTIVEKKTIVFQEFMLFMEYFGPFPNLLVKVSYSWCCAVPWLSELVLIYIFNVVFHAFCEKPSLSCASKVGFAPRSYIKYRNCVCQCGKHKHCILVLWRKELKWNVVESFEFIACILATSY